MGMYGRIMLRTSRCIKGVQEEEEEDVESGVKTTVVGTAQLILGFDTWIGGGAYKGKVMAGNTGITMWFTPPLVLCPMKNLNTRKNPG